MKEINNMIYWTSTFFFTFGMFISGVFQLLHFKEMDELIAHVGYPMYFMYIIGTWKMLGIVAIIIPKYTLLKEWAYAGFFFLMTGALISHLAIGDGGKAIFGPLFQIIFIVLSWYFRPSDRKIKSDN